MFFNPLEGLKYAFCASVLPLLVVLLAPRIIRCSMYKNNEYWSLLGFSMAIACGMGTGIIVEGLIPRKAHLSIDGGAILLMCIFISTSVYAAIAVHRLRSIQADNQLHTSSV